MKRIIFITLLGLCSAKAMAAPELKGSPNDLRGFLYPAENIVTIRAEHEEKAYSDQAIISLVITTEQKLLSDSISRNSQIREKITASLVASGLSGDTIKSSKFSSSPEFGWFGSKPSSFKVVNRMAITIADEEKLKQIAALADKYDEVELSDTAFEHSQKASFEQLVKSKALDKIIQQKEFYEKSLGLKLKAIGIRDSNIRHQATRGAMLLDSKVVNIAQDERSYSSKPKSPSMARTQSFDEIKYLANLSVDFKILE